MAWPSTITAILALVSSCAALRAQVAISGRVVDETGAGVSGARIEILAADAVAPLVASSDLAGNFQLVLPAAGAYQILAERQGFYLFRAREQRFDSSPSQLTIVLNHRQEFSERVDVTASPPAIDPQQPAERKVVDSAEIDALPYSGSQDFRNALSLIDGAVRDGNGDYHFNGAGAGQTAYSLDGFNIANPVTGWLDARVNVDSVQFLNVETSRVSAENGRGSAGALELETKMGDDRLRFGGTNFVPGLSSAGGFHLNHWTPRLEVSGPIRKGRAWFYNGADLYYSNDTVSGLPHGQNRTSGTTFSDLARFRVDLAPSNVATGSVLLDISDRIAHRFERPQSGRDHHRQPPDADREFAARPAVFPRRRAAGSRLRGYARFSAQPAAGRGTLPDHAHRRPGELLRRPGPPFLPPAVRRQPVSAGAAPCRDAPAQVRAGFRARGVSPADRPPRLRTAGRGRQRGALRDLRRQPLRAAQEFRERGIHSGPLDAARGVDARSRSARRVERNCPGNGVCAAVFGGLVAMAHGPDQVLRGMGSLLRRDQPGRPFPSSRTRPAWRRSISRAAWRWDRWPPPFRRSTAC